MKRMLCLIIASIGVMCLLLVAADLADITQYIPLTKNYDWLSFLGAVIGGIATFGGVFLTWRYQIDSDKEKERLCRIPVLEYQLKYNKALFDNSNGQLAGEIISHINLDEADYQNPDSLEWPLTLIITNAGDGHAQIRDITIEFGDQNHVHIATHKEGYSYKLVKKNESRCIRFLVYAPRRRFENPDFLYSVKIWVFYQDLLGNQYKQLLHGALSCSTINITDTHADLHYYESFEHLPERSDRTKRHGRCNILHKGKRVWMSILRWTRLGVEKVKARRKMKKNHNVVFSFVSAIAITLLLLLLVFVFEKYNIHVPGSREMWIGLIGALLGGAYTLLGVQLTLNHQAEADYENQRLTNLPILKIDVSYKALEDHHEGIFTLEGSEVYTSGFPKNEKKKYPIIELRLANDKPAFDVCIDSCATREHMDVIQNAAYAPARCRLVSNECVKSMFWIQDSDKYESLNILGIIRIGYSDIFGNKYYQDAAFSYIEGTSETDAELEITETRIPVFADRSAPSLRERILEEYPYLTE